MSEPVCSVQEGIQAPQIHELKGLSVTNLVQ